MADGEEVAYVNMVSVEYVCEVNCCDITHCTLCVLNRW
jgi:hypothetical protein